MMDIIQVDEISNTRRRRVVRVNNSRYTRVEDYAFSTTIPRKKIFKN
jgi:hypothetical protein